MFGTMMKILAPIPPQRLLVELLPGNFDTSLLKTSIYRRKHQRMSFSIFKAHFAQRQKATSPSQHDKKEDEKTDHSTSSSPPSIIARRIFLGKEITRNDEQDNHTLLDSAGDLRKRLEIFSKQAQDETSQLLLNHRRADSINEDVTHHKEYDSVEQIVLKDDVLMQPKPSSLLGTEDPNVRSSRIPCVGCGAMLQCHNRVVPGFLPSESFKLMTERELKTSICQRCHYIQHHNTFFAVSAPPVSYAEMISQIRDVRSLVVMIIDVMDIPGSIVPNLMDYIGHKHPVIIVGNKADLLAPDSPDYLVNAREEVKRACHSAGYSNIRKVVFVSAKTGFGVEKLINLLISYYKHKVDVFIVGSANAGKSSLFNALLASDYCKHTARDLIQRATVSVWPGTTLNFLKFPIMRSSSRTVTLRHKRLRQEEAIRKDDKKLKDERKKKKQNYWELTGMVNKTDVRTDEQKKKEEERAPWGQHVAGYIAGTSGDIHLPSCLPAPSVFEEDNFSDSYWLYDTPGVLNPDQIMNLLEQDESSFLSPVCMIVPRCILLKPGFTAFISGLSRLDYVKGDESLIAIVHCSSSLPVKVVLTEEADEFYRQNLGTPQLGVPIGDRCRLDKIPSLVMKEFDFVGERDDLAVADIQLSSLGWVSIAPKTGCCAKLRAFTPGGKGLSLRTPPLAARYTQFRGKRIAGTPFFHTRPQGSAMIGKTIVKVEK